jgi:hypothetical protein
MWNNKQGFLSLPIWHYGYKGAQHFRNKPGAQITYMCVTDVRSFDIAFADVRNSHGHSPLGPPPIERFALH